LFGSHNETFTGSYLIMLVYRCLLTITLMYMAKQLCYHKFIYLFKLYLFMHVILLFWSWRCKEVHAKTSCKNIMCVIDRGVLHNYVHMWSNLFCMWHNLVKPLQSIVTFFTNFSPFYKGVEEKGKEQLIKGKSMAQWINLLRNSSFVN